MLLNQNKITHESRKPSLDYSLPQLKPEVKHAVGQEIVEKEPLGFMLEAHHRLVANNQVLDNAIEGLILRVEDEAAKDLARNAAWLVHELLLRQAEADTLEAQFSQQ